MSVKCLAVDSDFDTSSKYVLEWERRGVSMDCAINMMDAIKMLQSENGYIFVGINADVIDFMPLLSTMRSMTNTPILIATSNFTTEKEIAALEEGADLFARWHSSPEDNVASVLAHIARKTTRNDASCNVLIYKNLLIAPAQRSVFIDNNKITFTRREYDLLLYLVSNQDKTLTFEQMHNSAWNDVQDNFSKDAVKSVVKRLREKLSENNACEIKIMNIRGVGYRLPPSNV